MSPSLALSISFLTVYVFMSLILQDNKCIAIDWRATKVLVSLRSITDLIFFINILLQVCLHCSYLISKEIHWL